MNAQRIFHGGAIASLVLLIIWLVTWEMVIAPLHPGGSLLAAKALPLLIPLRGVVKRDIYTLQWSAMVILLYFIEGAVRAWSDTSAAVAHDGVWRNRPRLRVFRLRAAVFASVQASRQAHGQGTAGQGQSLA